MPMRRLAAALVPLLSLFGCDETKEATPIAESAAPSATPVAKSSSSAVPLAAGAMTLTIAYGSEKKTWLEEQAKKFEATSAKTKAGHVIKIKTIAEGSGEAVQGILSGEQKPHVFSPASGLYVQILNSKWGAAKNTAKPISPAGEPLVLSPIVVAMWKPMAEAMGWPGKSIGWVDLVKINADPKGWGALGHPEWGRFKLGHTHPEFSNSGLQSIVAEAYAGAKKTRDLKASDLDAKATVSFFGSVEQTIVHYGKSTGFFADKMLERGPAYLSAAVLYENLVIESYANDKKQFPVVALYPVEGTFWSDHPYAVLDAPWVGDEEREAAQAFLAFLKAKPQQERALALGFRPADPSVAIGAPVDSAHGVDPKQPQTLLEVPDGAVIDKLIDTWQNAAKRASDVILVFDKSGSMSGKPMEQAKLGADAFVNILRDRDEMTLQFFDGNVYPPFGPKKLATGRKDIISRIDSTIADGKTSLYDSISTSFDSAQKRVKTAPEKIHAVVVMTDGMDEGSKLTLDELMKRLGGESDSAVKVFTIAYGDAADQKTLVRISEAARGSSLVGKPDSIVDVYKEMAAFF